MSPINKFGQAFLCLFLSSTCINAQWDPNAGVVISHASGAAANATSHSNTNVAGLALDGNEDTYWESEYYFPNGFFAEPRHNVLLATTAAMSSSNGSQLTDITDGIMSTNVNFSNTSGQSWVKIAFPTAQQLHLISLRAVISNDSIKVEIYDQQGNPIKIGSFKDADSYASMRYSCNQLVSAIKLSSNSSFKLFELGATKNVLHEDLNIDLGQAREIGMVYIRLASAGAVDSVHVDVSNDNINWTTVAKPNPGLYFMVPYPARPVITGRYMRIRSYLQDQGYVRAKVVDVQLFDENGIYGAMPAPKPSTRPLSEMFGINAIWAWGHGLQGNSDNLGGNEGPQLYSRVAKHARNYHEMDWDVSDPDNIPDYNNMPGSLHQTIVDWDREYGAWKTAGLAVQTTIQFLPSHLPKSKWDDPYQAAYDYGYAFATHFGPTNGNGLVKIIEIGNEPWTYDATFYKEVLLGMAQGAKAADSAMQVFPCALQAAFPDAELKNFKNFMGARLTATEAPYLDGINLHTYSYTTNSVTGNRTGTYPENPASTMQELKSGIRFRDANMPGKKIIVSEWGWDSDGGGQNCTHNECVSEEAQAIYGIRGIFMMDRLGIERSSWFFFKNSSKNSSSLYSRSGLTGPITANLPLKKSFIMFESVLEKMGNSYFLDTLSENDEAWAYLYGDTLGNPTYIVAWKPIALENQAVSQLSINTAYHADSAWTLSGPTALSATMLPKSKNGVMNFPVSATPVLVKLDSTSGSTISIPEIDVQKNSFTIYPNPTNGQFSVGIFLTESSPVSMRLYSIDGRAIQEIATENGHAGNNTFTVNRTGLAPGVYIMEVNIEAQSRSYRKQLMLVR